MKAILSFYFLLFTFCFATAQSNIQQPTSINSDGSAPAASAMLDVSATDKGMLVPRMTSAQRTMIAAPATGLLVFDTDTGGFWFYSGIAWTQVPTAYIAGTGISIAGSTISNTGDPNPADDLTTGSTAGGDLTDTYPNPTVAANAIGSAEITDGSVAAGDLGAMGAASGQVMRWNGSAWVPGSTVDAVLQDADADTKIQVEESPDEDIIRFDVGGTEGMVLRKNTDHHPRLEMPSNQGNTFIGQNAGSANTTGHSNTAVGLSAFQANATGNHNTANGRLALFSNTTGSENTAIGRSAMYSNTTGDDNTAVGRNALTDNTGGTNNTAIGSAALLNNTTGFSNVGIGRRALYRNTVNSNLVAVGDSALYNNGIGAANLQQGSDNVAFGSKALFSNTEGYYNSAVGNRALYSNTTGIANTAIGVQVLFSNTIGHSNTANGFFALYSNTIGIANTAIGVQALYSNTGSYNTANGYRALYSNTSGDDNTASGRRALYSNTTGYDNTASGTNALSSNTTGYDNTASGTNALSSNTEGNYNTASGSFALQDNTTGDDNTASGTGALYSNTTGYDNTASGTGALYSNTTGDYNTASGRSALSFNTEGDYNTASGSFALSSNTTGDYNTALGYNAEVSSDNLVNATAIGARAKVGTSNSLVLGSINGVNFATASVNVGIGTTTPDVRLHVEGGSDAEPDGGGFIQTGASSGSNIVMDNNEIMARNNGAVSILILNKNGGNVGIGTTTPDERLEVVGNVYASGGDFYTDNTSGVINAGGGFMATLINIIAENTPTPMNAGGDEDLYIEDDLELGSQGYKPGGGFWVTASDARLKKDIQPYTDGLAQLLQIKPVRYRYNEVFPIPDGGREYVGVLAQDVLPVAPYMVELKPFGEQTIEDENGVEHVAKAGTPYYTYDGSALTYMLVNAVKEQQGEIEIGKLEIEKLMTENAVKDAEISALKSQLDKITAALAGAGISVEK